MRRFDDFLKLFAGLLIALIVRDRINITINLQNKINSEIISNIFVIITFPWLLRNVHCSILWDKTVDATGFRCFLEDCHRGRALLFVTSFLAFVLMPLGVIFKLSGEVKGGNPSFLIIFLGPFVMYLIWDLILFFSGNFSKHSKDKNSEDKKPIKQMLCETILNWLILDSLIIFLMLCMLTYFTQQQDGLRAKDIVMTFEILAVLSFLLDYIFNFRFYFQKNHVI